MNDDPMTQQERENLNTVMAKVSDLIKMASTIETLADDLKEIRTALMGSKLTGDPGFGEKINSLRLEIAQLKVDFDLEKRHVHEELNKSKWIRVGMTLAVGIIGGILGVVISLVTIFNIVGSFTGG